MGQSTAIGWTDHTFNPWWGCIRVSPGCEHCYAETFAKRLGLNIWGSPKNTARRTFGEKHWQEPRRWHAAAERVGLIRRVFCASMADVFEDHPQVVDERAKLWALIRETPSLDWQLLTKRPENIARMLPDDWNDGYRNVWLGTSVENQRAADERLPALLTVPAHVRFLSCEPLLGDVDLSSATMNDHTPALRGSLHWVIVGGESGPRHRPMNLEWARAIVRECARHDVRVFMKQDSGPKAGNRGRIPDDLWVHEFPRSMSAPWPRYTYLGDRLTDPGLVGRACSAVLRAEDKCVRGRGSMLVLFDGENTPRNVIARRLRRIT